VLLPTLPEPDRGGLSHLAGTPSAIGPAGSAGPPRCGHSDAAPSVPNVTSHASVDANDPPEDVVVPTESPQPAAAANSSANPILARPFVADTRMPEF